MLYSLEPSAYGDFDSASSRPGAGGRRAGSFGDAVEGSFGRPARSPAAGNGVMADTEIELIPGVPGDDDGEGWSPRVALDHDGWELYVIVGEEVAGMVEGVNDATWERIKARLADG